MKKEDIYKLCDYYTKVTNESCMESHKDHEGAEYDIYTDDYIEWLQELAYMWLYKRSIIK